MIIDGKSIQNTSKPNPAAYEEDYILWLSMFILRINVWFNS